MSCVDTYVGGRVPGRFRRGRSPNGPSTALDKPRNFSLRSFDLVKCKYLSDVNIGEVLSVVSCRPGVHGGVVIHGGGARAR